MASGHYHKRNAKRHREEPSFPVIAVVIVLLAVLGAGVFLMMYLMRQTGEEVPVAAQSVTLEDAAQATEPLPAWAMTQPQEEVSEGPGAGEDEEEEETRQSLPYSEETIRIVSEMSLEEKVAQLFFITPEALTGYQLVTQCGDVTRAALDATPVGGLIFLAKNLEDPEQTREMLTGITRHVTTNGGLPVFLALDEEGGRVMRIGSNDAFGVTRTPAMEEVAQGGEAAVFEAAFQIGIYLQDLGFNMDLAPVADVLTNPDNQVIGDRAFSSDAEEVARLAAEYANALSQNGILPVYKHFPGHGDTMEDSHDDYAYSYKTLDELYEAELIPFLDGAQKQIPVFMIAHISLPEITGGNVPATLSYDIVTGLLREEIGYEGVIMTDALDMGAVSNHFSPEEACVLAIQAGCDMLLMENHFETCYRAVLDAVRNGEITEERIDASVLRIIECKRNLL
ncbi:MAG: glycoside hydrolase family 3 protein [Lachnospiraceae bacterium]|nr:glycoside hydrolase family 3 protein [Lachnospiraceae bacterium]